MNEPRDHHFIPQFLLRRWAVNDGRLVRFYRPYRDVVSVRQAPAGVGYRRDLYSLEGWPAESVTAIERQYMGPVVDDPAAKALEALVARDEGLLTPELRVAWVRFLMSLRVRIPQSVAAVADEWKARIPEAIAANPEDYEAIRRPGDPATMLEWVERHVPGLLEQSGKHLLPALIENDEVGTVMLRMNWNSVEFAPPFPDLLLGDNPLVMTHAVKDPRCAIALPMTPSVLFIATHSQEATEQLLERGGDRLVPLMNESTLGQAVHDVFGTTERHLQFVENRLRPRPEAKL